MMLDYMLNEDDNFLIAGQVGILDLSGVTVQHFLQFNPTFIKKMTVLTQDAAPGRQKGLHWINTPRGFEQVFNLFTGFMNEKNRSRVRQFNFSSYLTLISIFFLTSFSFTVTLSHYLNMFQSDCYPKSMVEKLELSKPSSTNGRSGLSHIELIIKKKIRFMVLTRKNVLDNQKVLGRSLALMEHFDN